MKKLCPTKTSTPERVKTGVPSLLHRETYRKKSLESLAQNTFSTESPIMAYEDCSEDKNKEVRKTSKNSKKQDRNVTLRSVFPKVKYVLKMILGCIIGSCVMLCTDLYCSSAKAGVIKEFSLGHLRSKYSSIQPESVFDELQQAVSRINRNGNTLSYVFAHHGNAEARNTALEVSAEVATLAADYLGNGTVFTISREMFDTNAQADYGELITKWRPIMEECRVMRVPDLNAFPTNLASVFHTLCDEFTPYVRHSLCLHTVDLGSIYPSQGVSVKGYFTAVEKRLRQSWTTLSDEEFGPLLSRIAGGSVFLVV